MASLDTLSDAEIRSKLCDFGCEIGPVTPSTRRVYIKKLQSMIENGDSSSKVSQRDEKPAPAPPSPEESIFKNRRKSGGQTRNKSPARAPHLNPLASSTFVDGTPPRSVKALVNDVRPAPVSTRDGTPQEKRVTSSTTSSHDDDTLPYKPTYNLNSYGPSSGSKFNSPPFSSGTSSYRPKLSDFDPDQPYASDFTRRLSNSSVSRLAAQTGVSPRSPLLNSKIYDNVKESDDEDDNQGPIYSAKVEHSSRSPQYHRGNGQVYSPQNGWFTKDASVYIIGFLALFFLFIAYIYLHIHHSSDGKVQNYIPDLHYPKCTGVSEHCIPEHEISRATTVFKLICSELEEMASRSSCSDSGEPKLCNEEASRVVNARDGSLSVFELDHYIHYAGILANSNPSKNVMYNANEGFKLRELPTSLLCSLIQHTMSLTVWLFRAALCLVVGLSVYGGIRWWTARKNKHQEEVMKLFNQMIELVSTTSSQDGPGFAVVNHIRDRLIPANDKTSKMKLWDEAVALLEGDTRVRTEVQQVEGEDFLVWRWLAPPPNPKKKVWQGQAFETMDGSVNSLPESPTSCLKIRHMFDPTQEEGDSWVGTVADAILEKCKDAVIYHIVVEKQSPEGCVYVKCASQRDAGIAYRALHGFWFDSKLVTVKYIREARYLERFPDSARAKYPLVPSNRRHH